MDAIGSGNHAIRHYLDDPRLADEGPMDVPKTSTWRDGSSDVSFSITETLFHPLRDT